MNKYICSKCKRKFKENMIYVLNIKVEKIIKLNCFLGGIESKNILYDSWLCLDCCITLLKQKQIGRL